MRRHPARAMYDPQHQAKWVRQFQKCTGIPCELKVNDGAGFDVPEDHAATIFDIYNEALCNA